MSDRGEQPVDATEVLLVSSDLLLGSRLRSALAGIATVRAVTAVADGARPGLVFVDLNEDVEARVDAIRRLAVVPAASVIGFCNHDQRALRVRAMEAGARQVVTNGALQEAARRVLGAGARA